MRSRIVFSKCLGYADRCSLPEFPPIANFDSLLEGLLLGRLTPSALHVPSSSGTHRRLRLRQIAHSRSSAALTRARESQVRTSAAARVCFSQVRYLTAQSNLLETSPYSCCLKREGR